MASKNRGRTDTLTLFQRYIVPSQSCSISSTPPTTPNNSAGPNTESTPHTQATPPIGHHSQDEEYENADTGYNVCDDLTDPDPDNIPLIGHHSQDGEYENVDTGNNFCDDLTDPADDGSLGDTSDQPLSKQLSTTVTIDDGLGGQERTHGER